MVPFGQSVQEHSLKSLAKALINNVIWVIHEELIIIFKASLIEHGLL